MNPFMIIIYMIFFLPLFIIKEAIGLFTGRIPKDKRASHVLWILIIVLSILVLVLWIKGYR